MPDLNDFAKRMHAISLKIDEGALRVKLLTALVIDQELVLATPVDTGRARSNWQLSVGRPILEEIAPYAPGRKLGLGEGANASAAMAQARAAGLKARSEEDIFITNNVKYISLLNEGTSAQAPAGFIEIAVASAKEFIRSQRLLD